MQDNRPCIGGNKLKIQCSPSGKKNPRKSREQKQLKKQGFKQ